MRRKSVASDWLDLKRLRYFMRIAESNSYSRAAIALGIGQPALSRYIRDIENDIGLTLFYRDGRGVKLTEAGERLYANGRDIVARVESAKLEIAGLQGELSGKVTLAIQPSIGRLLTAPIARRVLADMPKVHLHIVEGMSGHLASWLSNGTVDIALHYDQPNLSRMPREKVAAQDLLLVAPRAAGLRLDSARSFTEVTKLPLILPGRPHSLRITLDALASRRGLTLNVPVEVDSANGITELIEAGAGYGVLPMASFARALRDGSVSACRINKPQITRILLMMTASHQPVTPLAKKLMEIVRDESRKVSSLGGELIHLPRVRAAS
ncbi:MAG: LysR family transcriptional regulator [Reyranellaceae bacterium]